MPFPEALLIRYHHRNDVRHPQPLRYAPSELQSSHRLIQPKDELVRALVGEERYNLHRRQISRPRFVKRADHDSGRRAVLRLEFKNLRWDDTSSRITTIERSSVELKENQEKKFHWWEYRFSRRTGLVTGFLLGVAGGIAGIKINEITGLVKKILRAADRSQQLLSLKSELDSTINSFPPPEKLEAGMYNPGPIDLTEEKKEVEQNAEIPGLLDVDFIFLGSSILFKNGMKLNGNSPLEQFTAYPQIAINAVDQNILNQAGIGKIRVYVVGVPGAPSGTGFVGEVRQYGVRGPEQLGDKLDLDNNKTQQFIRFGNQLKIVVVEGGQNNFRELPTSAAEAAVVFENIAHVTTSDDPKIDKKINELKQLKGKAFKIADEVGMDMEGIADLIDQLNTLRLKDNLPNTILVYTYPWNLRYQNHIPISFLDGDNNNPNLEGYVVPYPIDPNDPTKFYLDLNKFPGDYGHLLAYVITALLWIQLNEKIPKAAEKYPNLKIRTQNFLNITQQHDHFFQAIVEGQIVEDGDGHAGKRGVVDEARVFLELMKILVPELGEKSLNDIAQLPTNNAT